MTFDWDIQEFANAYPAILGDAAMRAEAAIPRAERAWRSPSATQMRSALLALAEDFAAGIPLHRQANIAVARRLADLPDAALASFAEWLLHDFRPAHRAGRVRHAGPWIRHAMDAQVARLLLHRFYSPAGKSDYW